MKKLFLAAALLALAVPAAMAKNDALSLVPNDAVTVGVVHLTDLRTSPLGATLFKETDKISTDGDAEKFLRDAGMKPSTDIDTIVVATTPRTALGSDVEELVALDGRFNVERLTSALAARGVVKKASPNGAYHLLPEEHGVDRSEEHTSELQSQSNLVCRLLLEKKTNYNNCGHDDARYAQNILPPSALPLPKPGVQCHRREDNPAR